MLHALVITQLLGIKEKKKRTKKNHSGKEELSQKINTLCKDISLIERWETGMLRQESQKTRLDHLYRVKRKE